MNKKEIRYYNNVSYEMLILPIELLEFSALSKRALAVADSLTLARAKATRDREYLDFN